MEIKQKEYLKAIEADYEKIDYTAWINGQYIISSIQTALDPKKAKYPDKPFGKEENIIQQHPEIQAKKFEDWANVYNKKFEQKQDGHSA
jgi:hypothetical protein